MQPHSCQLYLMQTRPLTIQGFPSKERESAPCPHNPGSFMSHLQITPATYPSSRPLSFHRARPLCPRLLQRRARHARFHGRRDAARVTPVGRVAGVWRWCVPGKG